MNALDDNPLTHAILYAAKSTADEHGSIATQIADGYRVAEREGWTVAAQYEDEKASAYSGNRGQGLADAMAHAERLPVTTVVACSSRSTRTVSLEATDSRL